MTCLLMLFTLCTVTVSAQYIHADESNTRSIAGQAMLNHWASNSTEPTTQATSQPATQPAQQSAQQAFPETSAWVMGGLYFLSLVAVAILIFRGWFNRVTWESLPTRPGRFTFMDPWIVAVVMVALGVLGLVIKYPVLLPIEVSTQTLLATFGALQFMFLGLVVTLTVIAIFRSTLQPEVPEDKHDFLDVIDGFGFGLGPDIPRTFNHIFFGVPASMVIILTISSIYMFMVVLIGIPINTVAHESLEMLQSGEITLQSLILQAVVIAPIMEEIIFRGFMHTSLTNQRFKLPRWVVISICAFLFMIAHTFNSDWYALPLLFILGWIWGAVYEHTRSLIPCILMHMAFNGFNVWMVYSQMSG